MATIRQSSMDPGIIVAATLDDAVNETRPFRAICFGGAGTLKITGDDDVAITIPSGLLSANVFHPIRVKRVWQTGTSATNVYGLI